MDATVNNKDQVSVCSSCKRRKWQDTSCKHQTSSTNRALKLTEVEVIE